jgi:site-specific DNA recombinase
MVRAGEIGAIVAWHPDRLHRRPIELEDFIALVEEHGVEVVTVTAGERDLSTPTGRLHARIEGAVARHESEHKAERQRRKHREMAEQGRPSGGGRRAFGYGRDGVALVPEEAAAVRTVADMLLGGHSIRSCTAWLREEGPPTVLGRPWADATVRT